MKPQRNYSLYFWVLTGALGIFLGHPNPLLHLPPAVLLTPLSLYAVAGLGLCRKHTFFAGWAMGLLGQSAALYWLTITMHNEGELPYIFAVPAVMLAASYLGCWQGIACLGMRATQQFFAQAHASPMGERVLGLLAPVLGGLIFGGCEVGGGFVFTGFPWLNLSTAFAPWLAWIQAASLVGSYGLSAVYAIMACCMAVAMGTAEKNRIASGVLGICLLAAIIVFGVMRLNSAQTRNPENAISVLMVQGNINQNQKWVPAYQQETIRQYTHLSQQGLDQWQREHPKQPVRLVLWPETAMPFYFQSDAAYAAQLRGFAAKNNVGLGFGTLGYRRENGKASLFNRFVLLDAAGNGSGVYDKQHLVPFGEYVPLNLDLSFLSHILQGMTFSSGQTRDALQLSWHDPLADAPTPPLVNGQPQVIAPHAPSSATASPANIALGMLICYEAIFPELAQARVKNGATVLASISNDAWFGDSAAPWQHLHLAVMRSVEQFRPMLRATNTGITVLISPYGAPSQAAGPLFTSAAKVERVHPESTITLYHRLHPWIEIFLVLCAALALAGNLRANKL